MSVIFNCAGFARVAVKESFRKIGSASVETNPSEKWKNYLAAFEGDSQEVCGRTFHLRQEIQSNLQLFPKDELKSQGPVPRHVFNG